MEFQKFKKIPRLSRECIITEKIDGTNGQIIIISQENFELEHVGYAGDSVDAFFDQFCIYQKDNLYIFAGSKSRWLDISSKGDNYGFAKWVQANAEELLKLGEGRHYGEWFGKGIQRGYGLDEKRFALFNVRKWISSNLPTEFQSDKIEVAPSCCEVVPILCQGMFDTELINDTVNQLAHFGSSAVPGYMNPEGIIIYHTASGQMFKKTIKDDEKPKGTNDR